MSLELFSIVVLLVMFVVCSVLPINLGLVSYVAAFLIGTLLAGLAVDDIFGGFPGDLFVLLVGITFMFAIAQNNGTIDLLMDWGVRMVGGNVGLIPWIMFALTALFAGVGALSAAAVAIVAPIALRFAAQHNISALLMGVMVVQGATAGSYSPISPFGVIANGVLDSQGLPQAPVLLFVNSLAFNTVVAAFVFVAFGGLRLLRSQGSPVLDPVLEQPAPAGVVSGSVGSIDSTGGGSNPEEHTEGNGDGMTLYKGATLAGIVLLIVLALGFGVDVGFAAMTIALALVLMSPGQQAEAFRRMPWSVIVLITGILTYIAVLEAIGTIDYVQDLIAGVGNPLIAALAASYVGGIISAFASTAGILGAAIPLAAPILGQTALPAIGVVSSIAIASAIVDVSPFSTNGALLLANAQNIEERVFFRQLLLWAVAVTAFAPLLTWFVFVVIGIP